MYQRQRGEIVTAEYPYWCSECLRFGHKSVWCGLRTAKPFLWYYDHIQEDKMRDEDHCTKCSESHPDAANSHTTKNCGLLVPYDHPENKSFDILDLPRDLVREFARPRRGQPLSPLPRCLIFSPEDRGFSPEYLEKHEQKWDTDLLGFKRMLAGMIYTRKNKNKNDSIPILNKASQRVWSRLLGQHCEPWPRALLLSPSYSSGRGETSDDKAIE
jgi:hypothetical protein